MMTPAIRNSYPRLNDRALGWLNFLHQKAMTPDDWSQDGTPHEWWDRASSPPMCSFPRFDLQESTYAIGLMADQTPAWREAYGRILNALAERYLTYWAAVDWLSQFGPDPKRKTYPPEWKGMLIPEEFWGDYDAPGWVANGIEPWGLQPDPIGAEGNLFFKGWLNLTQALHTYVTGEDKWGEPFMMAGVERTKFEWTQHRLVEHLVHQWTAHPMGLHCENTKAWPFCLSAAGLGLQMYDGVFGKSAHQVYGQWLEHTREKYYGFDKSGALQWVAMYYDPLKKHTHRTLPVMGLAIAFYAMPQSPEFAEKLYRAAVAFMQWDNPASPIMAPPDPRMMTLGLATAKEFGDYATEARLRAHAEANFEPCSFGEGEGQFGYWFGLGENWPRGQLSALAICADVGEKGAWMKLFRQPNLSKFAAPSVEGVDFPALSVAQAWHDDKAGLLQLCVFDGNRTKSGNKTKLKIVNLPAASEVKIHCDGAEFGGWRVSGDGEIEIDTTIAAHSFQIYTGYKGRKEKLHEQSLSISKPVSQRRPRAASESRPQAAGGTARFILPQRISQRIPRGIPSCCASGAGVSAA